MSDSYRFIVFGTMHNAQGVEVIKGPFYVKEENGWRVYIGGDDFPINVFNLKNQVVLAKKFQTSMLKDIVGIVTTHNFVLLDIKWIGNFVDHKHIKK